MGGPQSVGVYDPGAVIDGKLRVERLLGEGGMGAVYEVTHELTHHRRALKLLHAHFARQKTTVDRFLREASAAGKIGSPHIIETFDAGWLTTGEPFVLMEFLEGETLGDRLEAEPEGMDLGVVATLFDQLCRGVQAAHDAGIIHRDLKPDNIFLCAGDEPFVKILDFGVSKFDHRHTKLGQETRAGATVGTPGYMSLEQIDDSAEVDERADVYALGVILYEALTGRHPYPATSFIQLAKKVAAGKFEPPSSLRPGLPESIDALMVELLAPQRDARLDSARGLGNRLAELGLGDGRVVVVSDREPVDVMDGTQASFASATAVSPGAPVSPKPHAVDHTVAMEEAEPRGEETEPQGPASEEPEPGGQTALEASIERDVEAPSAPSRTPVFLAVAAVVALGAFFGVNAWMGEAPVEPGKDAAPAATDDTPAPISSRPSPEPVVAPDPTPKPTPAPSTSATASPPPSASVRPAVRPSSKDPDHLGGVEELP